MTAGVGLWGGLNCLLGRHVRSRGQARATADGWVTRCARCAIPMARAHGGGTWEVVKTPMRNKPRKSGEAPAETLAKAIVRSGKAVRRKEAKAQKALKAAFLDDAPDTIEEQSVAQPVSQRGPRRFRFFRGKPMQDEGEAAMPLDAAIDAAGDGPPPRKSWRSLLGRKRAIEPAAAPSLAQEAAIVAAPSKRTLRRSRKHRDTGDTGQGGADASL